MIKKIGKVILGKRPEVCAVFQNIPKPHELRVLKRAGVRLVELRIDCFPVKDIASAPKILVNLKHSGFSTILTVRMKKEGGRRQVSDRDRLRLYENLGRFADAVDIEIQSSIAKKVAARARRFHCAVIGSFHDFKKTPSDAELKRQLNRAKTFRADIIKMAVFAKKESDLACALRFLIQHRSKHSLIMIAMGSLGKPTRITFPHFGSVITYGFAGKSSAPGQMKAEELARRLKLM